jgi:hypothetical protein
MSHLLLQTFLVSVGCERFGAVMWNVRFCEMSGATKLVLVLTNVLDLRSNSEPRSDRLECKSKRCVLMVSFSIEN